MFVKYVVCVCVAYYTSIFNKGSECSLSYDTFVAVQGMALIKFKKRANMVKCEEIIGYTIVVSNLASHLKSVYFSIQV